MKMPQPTTLDSASNKCFLEPRWMLQFLQDTFLLSLWSSAAPHIRDTGWGHTLGWPGSMGTALSSSSRESGSNILNYTDKTFHKNSVLSRKGTNCRKAAVDGRRAGSCKRG